MQRGRPTRQLARSTIRARDLELASAMTANATNIQLPDHTEYCFTQSQAKLAVLWTHKAG